MTRDVLRNGDDRNLVFGDLELGKKDEGAGRKSFVSARQPADDQIINIAPVLNHNGAGVAGILQPRYQQRG
jgi:hypothetical protein